MSIDIKDLERRLDELFADPECEQKFKEWYDKRYPQKPQTQHGNPVSDDKELYEIKLCLINMYRVFRDTIKNKAQQKQWDNTEYILKKYFNPNDILRESPSTEYCEGEDDIAFDFHKANESPSTEYVERENSELDKRRRDVVYWHMEAKAKAAEIQRLKVENERLTKIIEKHGNIHYESQ